LFRIFGIVSLQCGKIIIRTKNIKEFYRFVSTSAKFGTCIVLVQMLHLNVRILDPPSGLLRPQRCRCQNL
jgi:hypothetical protein